MLLFDTLIYARVGRPKVPLRASVKVVERRKLPQRHVCRELSVSVLC